MEDPSHRKAASPAQSSSLIHFSWERSNLWRPADMEQSSFANKRVLITGGLGFIGSNLARRLLDLRASVTFVDSLVPEYGGKLFNIARPPKPPRGKNFDQQGPTNMRPPVSGNT